jgi:ribosome-binding protein aMBF1 (putative translation factor)
MDDLKRHITEFKKKHPGRAKNLAIGYENFKIGSLLKTAREEAGLTQKQIARKIGSKKKIGH